MQLSGLSDLLRNTPTYHEVLAHLHQGGDLALDVVRSARAYVVAALTHDWDAPIIMLTAQIKQTYNSAEQIPVWLKDRSTTIYRFAEPTPQFYERVPWSDSVIRARVETLNALSRDKNNPVIVSSARALMQRTMPVSQFMRCCLTITINQRWQIDKLLLQWVKLGYEAVPIVVEPGTFSHRGGILDIFPMSTTLPVRVDFFDEEIESLRCFDPATQRSKEHLQSITIPPAREALPSNTAQIASHLRAWFKKLPSTEDDMTTPATDAEPLLNGSSFPYIEHYIPYIYDNPISLLDYAPEDTLIVIEDWEDLKDTVIQLQEDAEKTRVDLIESNQLPPNFPSPYVNWETLNYELSRRQLLFLDRSPFQYDDTQELAERFERMFTPGERFGGQLRSMLTELRKRHNKRESIVLITGQSGRLTQLWYEQDASAYIPLMKNIETIPKKGSLLFINGILNEGWSFKGEDSPRLHLLTDAEIFGWSRPEPRRRRTAKHSQTPEAQFSDWGEGDYVVHVDYGIGRFAGMRHRTIEGNEREYLLVEYAENSLIFVPIHQTDRLTKYVGANDTPPKLHKIGQTEWNRIKNRTKKAIQDEAEDLLKLYAVRAQTIGYAYAPDSHWQHELEASFPYVETEDQLRAVIEVKADMEAKQPMDRLICGDVGFGKTEVALRATFKAVMDGKQVAVLAPTTVLAQQHYDTFRTRLVQFPVIVEMMSRFRTKEQQKQILPKIASGEVDILIGTHRILSKDVTFKDLSLIIIDEEQRFGVKHKEHFKKLRAQIDVLTLTATPIPRTLHMSLSGVRDISMIQTPPEERLPIITHVGKLDEKLIRQAILREIERGGQTFIVHNRIRTIEALHAHIQEIVPEARIVIGHGQMNERQLEGVMTAFNRGEFDVLLSTAIIENGIDIPNANTLIVDHADWFGMSQLYQLRGRVGRGAQQAYAYFFHGYRLTEEAYARLDTLAENTGLGSGFQIAIRDLEIRGAGDILSVKQTGHVAAVGLHLYTQLLSQAIKKMKGDINKNESDFPEQTDEDDKIVIDLPIPAYIPSDWIEEIALRLQIYRRIAGLTAQHDLEIMREELRDRFGQLPIAVDGLLYQIEIKILAKGAGATHIRERNGHIQVKLPYLPRINRSMLAQNLGDDINVTRTEVQFPMQDETWQLRLLDILTQLATGRQQVIEDHQGI